MKSKISVFAACSLVLPLALAASLAGCGSGNEPLSTLGSPTSVPNLELPIGTQLNWYVSPFNLKASPPVDGLQFTNVTFSNNAQNVSAPAAGVVTNVSSSTSNGTTVYSITIQHTIHFASRISEIASTNVRVGDYVSTGTLLGVTVSTVSNNNQPIAQLSVLLDGNAVCPYSYLSSNALNTINSRNFVNLTGVGICVQ